MKFFFKLIRWQNLVIIVLTQVLMRYAILKPVAGAISVSISASGNIEPLALQLPLLDFIILVLATVFIAAGGYVINDYFDIRTDLINRGDVIVGSQVTRRRAMMWHNLLNLSGVAAGFYVSYKIGYFWIGFVFLVISGLLYFYSAVYKKQFLIGNLIVALLTSMVPLMVVAFELPVMFEHYSHIANGLPSLKILVYWVGGFSLFAFLTTLAREIIKDMEDFEGDRAYGSNSVPVVAGITFSRILVSVIQLAVITLLLGVWTRYLHDTYTLIYILAAISLPLLGSLYYVISAKDQKGFYLGSLLMKICMLAGILYSVLVWLILEKGLIS